MIHAILAIVHSALIVQASAAEPVCVELYRNGHAVARGGTTGSALHESVRLPSTRGRYWLTTAWPTSPDDGHVDVVVSMGSPDSAAVLAQPTLGIWPDSPADTLELNAPDHRIVISWRGSCGADGRRDDQTPEARGTINAPDGLTR